VAAVVEDRNTAVAVVLLLEECHVEHDESYVSFVGWLLLYDSR